MGMYRIIDKESGLIYSEHLGWVEEHGEMYGHCFEWDEAELVGNKLSAEGISIEIKKDKVASRFERAVNFSFPKLYLATFIGFLSLFLILYLTKDISLTTSVDPVGEIKDVFKPIINIIFYVAIAMAVFMMAVALIAGRD